MADFEAMYAKLWEFIYALLKIFGIELDNGIA